MDWGQFTLPGLVGDLFPNPADKSQDYLSQIPGAIGQYYNPYIQAGQQAGGVLQGQYGNLLNNPGGMINQIGGGFQQSPGFNFALQQALKGANQAAAAGGMAGSPQNQQQNMGIATNLANQDYYNWLKQATGMYGMGLQGEQGMYGGGLEAGRNYSDQIAQALAAQAQLGYAGQANQNQMIGGLLGQGLGLAGLAMM